MRRFLSFLFFLCIPFVSTASNDPSDYTITVTADRLEQDREDHTDAVHVITKEEIRQSGAVTVLELLRDVAGVHIVQSGSAGKTTSVFVRGANPAQVLVLLDGVELNNPFFGGVDLSDLLAGPVERIEILKGPQSPLYGSDAIAGVIHLITRSPKDAFEGGAFAEAGGMRTFRESVRATAGYSRLKFELQANRMDTEGQFANDEFSDFQAHAKLKYSIRDFSDLSFHTSWIDSHIGIPFNGSRVSPDRNADNLSSTTGAGYDMQWTNRWSMKISGSIFHHDFDFSDPEDSFSQQTGNHTKSYRISLQNNMQLTEGDTLIIGAEWEKQNVAGTSNDSQILHEKIGSEALFFQNKLEWNSIVFTTGARLDHHSSFGSHFSPRISAAFRITEGWKLRASAGTAFRAPSAGELAYPFFGNRNLKPEKNRSFEIGFDYSHHADLSVTIFHSSFNDLISFDPRTFIAENIQEATTEGIEVSVSVPLKFGFQISSSYTFLQAENKIDQQPLVRRPKHSGSLTVSFDRERWDCYLNLTAIGKRYETDFSTFTNRYNAGFLKADATISYLLSKRFRLAFRVENFLDRQYNEAFGFPAPGRTGYTGLHFEF